MAQDTNKLLQEAYKTIDKMVTQTRQSKQLSEETRKDVLVAVSKDILSVLQPLLGEIAEKSKVNAKEITKAVSEATIRVNVEANTPEVNVNVPDVIIPEIKVPKIEYTPPTINLKDIKFPETQQIEGWVKLMGVSMEKPLPVTLRNADGSPANLFENLTTLVNQGGGGFRHVIVDKMPDISVTSAGASSVSLVNSDGTYYNSDNPLPVSFSAADKQYVEQVSGASWSVAVLSMPTVAVSGITNSVAASLLNGDGATLDPRDRNWTITETVPVSGTFYQATQPVSIASMPSTPVTGTFWQATQPVSGTVAVSSITSSTAASIVDSTGVQYSGSNPLPTYLVASSSNSVVVVGPIASDVADIGHAPVKTGALARTANPTAVAAGDVVSSAADDLGRQLMRPVQVRDLTVTAYASFTTGTEATLLAASAGSFHDLIYILASNNSTAAVGIDIRPVTAGNIAMHLEIPANGTVGVAAPVPIPQSGTDTGNNWTVDLPDITGTTVYVSGLFSREV